MADSAREVVENVVNAVTSIWDGMSITLSHLFRRPITIQYAGKNYGKLQLPEGLDITNLLPARYRGFLEVDLDICTGCLACERACPIDCIAIDIDKDLAAPKNRVMTRFDIDEAKCMYCGLCVEPCPTGAIVHTREFESSVTNLANLVFRFVDPSRPAPLYKPPKGADSYPRKMLGEIVRTLIPPARKWDAPPPPGTAAKTGH